MLENAFAGSITSVVWDEDPNSSRPLAATILWIVGIGSPVVIGMAIWTKDWNLFLLWFGVLLAILLPQVLMGLVAWTVAHLWYRIRDFRKPPPAASAKSSATDQPS